MRLVFVAPSTLGVPVCQQHIHIQSRSAAVDASGQASSGVMASRWHTVMLPRRDDVTKTAAWSCGLTMFVRDRWKDDVAL